MNLLDNLIDELGQPWRRDAACLHADPETFYPEIGESGADAIAICNGCPVRTECLEYALEHETYGDDFGVWGGLTPNERRKLRKAPGRRHGTRYCYERGCERDECREAANRQKSEWRRNRRAVA